MYLKCTAKKVLFQKILLILCQIILLVKNIMSLAWYLPHPPTCSRTSSKSSITGGGVSYDNMKIWWMKWSCTVAKSDSIGSFLFRGLDTDDDTALFDPFSSKGKVTGKLVWCTLDLILGGRIKLSIAQKHSSTSRGSPLSRTALPRKLTVRKHTPQITSTFTQWSFPCGSLDGKRECLKMKNWLWRLRAQDIWHLRRSRAQVRFTGEGVAWTPGFDNMTLLTTSAWTFSQPGGPFYWRPL